ncbi:Gfo/Idh/MocA family protein [Streptomyces lavendulae]|uniref:Gfo/Idh/MocA family protein n=1 Tax=Streptomyces lavendulae TaxID=1914 RepID=UPI00249FCDA1|nr:Gfo/Idh/MocA family oxidoreductase [Streptomyces lavendulae]GLV81623.1 inositol 2-dehydrogenase [Streptomyces lavendulae subsp. lavendulae]GLV96941.1 inositol 2-dehydrogenase [Streptomyces lavendulae subsp. lavendulae]GLX37188.1 inositol 2-dehydrogenase [Streptomyces roseochromogenus]
MSGTLGIAVIGTGRMGSDHVRRIGTTVGGARVVAVADPDGDRVKEVAAGLEGAGAYTDPGAAIAAPGVDAVLIASPGPAHEEAVLQALERRLPVLCEKPLTPDPEGALRIMEAERRLGRRLVQVGFMRRFDAEYERLKELLDAGGIGRPLFLHCRHRNASSPSFFTGDMLISDSVVHEVDAARWLLGQEVTAVTVLAPTPTSAAPQALGDPRFVLLETSGGAIVDVEIFVNCGFGYQVRCEAVGESGTARIGDGHAMVVESGGRWGGEVVQDYTTRFADAYDRQVRRWVAAAARGRVAGPDAWDGYAAAAVSRAGLAAARDGVRTEVRLVERPELYAAGRD